MKVAEFAIKAYQIVEKYFLPFATESRTPTEGIIQLRGTCKFGKGQKTSAKFFVTFSGAGLLVSTEANENGLKLLKLIKRTLGEPRGAYREKKETYHDFLKDHYTAEWYAEELHHALDAIDMPRAMLRATINSEIEPIEI